jgi:5-methylcytosine-specific restriction endonuclease McrA
MERASSPPRRLPSLNERLAPAVRVARYAESVMQIADSAPLPFAPQPKPARAPRLVAKQASRLSRREALKKASAKKQRTEYGARNSTPKWGDAKDRCRIRFNYRCAFAGTKRCDTPTLGLTPHHWDRTVGAGGDNRDENLILLCASCHDKAHAGHLDRTTIWWRLIDLGHIACLDAEALDQYDEAVSRFNGRAG